MLSRIYDHPRISRGGLSAHRTQEERAMGIALMKKQEKKESLIQTREDIEAKFLAPKSKNFVETEEVKELEDRILLWLNAGYPVHIVGPTGCGKTALAIRVAEKLNKPSIWINGDDAITTTDLVGGYSRIEMTRIRDKFIHNVHKDKDTLEPQWVSNPLALACKHGYTLIYNEFSRSRAEANNILLSVLEEGVLELPTKFGEERYVKVHSDFNAILTSNNIEYAGVHRPQDALLDRMATIHMGYYNYDTEVKIVQAHSKIPQEEAEKIVSIVRVLRNKFSMAEKPGTRPAIMIAQALAVGNGYDNKYFEQICIDAIASKFESPESAAKKISLIKQQISKSANQVSS